MIVICSKCWGTGRLCQGIGTHKSEYKVDSCDQCKGSGRMVQITRVSLELFDSERANPTRIY